MAVDVVVVVVLFLQELQLQPKLHRLVLLRLPLFLFGQKIPWLLRQRHLLEPPSDIAFAPDPVGTTMMRAHLWEAGLSLLLCKRELHIEI